ncbi:tRNA (adenosine(37)-N6)-dimethylallyltransferase MiaA [Hyphomicrobium facile]|uniref:tRNA dimethylallyltransferase n=1 Tax=Hyphomicrobium facile TaxID=51670 RepID=A0A1I7N410_9HYPH|nr:tRNA (adenosine(37)-N6)-dimethylallyltransferase MiaA [Hyphomicrobium facile]SFV29323.1 tRNA dimethylallyltransferase [Hyphomicrobium facile]
MSAAPNHTKPILIAGPTASGKSALAMAIAEHARGEIINADSMQVYRELRVLSARPSVEEEARVPHALYGFVPAGEAYSAGRFVRDAAAAIARARSAGRRPVIVGGTGLYFKALIEGLSPIPAIAADVRDYWRRAGEERGAGALHSELLRVDPVMAERLAPTDTQRIVRALEVIQSTGRSLAEWQSLRGEPVIEEPETVRLAVSGDRAELHARADARFDRMMREGALDEARALSALQLDPDLPAMRAIGVRPLLRLARGEIGEDEARELAKAETRQYIKRQETWLKRNMISWEPVTTKETASSLRDIFSFIQR